MFLRTFLIIALEMSKAEQMFLGVKAL